MKMLRNGEIRRRRESLGLSQHDAAGIARFGSRQRWTSIERGVSANPTLRTMLTVARVLDCRVCDLIVDRKPAVRRDRKRLPSG